MAKKADDRKRKRAALKIHAPVNFTRPAQRRDNQMG
jgi:hypothetical protein